MPVEIARTERSGVEIEGREEDNRRIPEWFGEAVLLGKYWLESGLVGQMEEEVKVVRGRMGQYEVIRLLAKVSGKIGKKVIEWTKNDL